MPLMAPIEFRSLSREFSEIGPYVPQCPLRASHIKMEGERFLALLKWPRGVNSAPGISSPQNH